MENDSPQGRIYKKMELRKREFKCPKCGYYIGARENDKVICMRPCGWSVLSKRKSDKEIQTVAELRANEGEA